MRVGRFLPAVLLTALFFIQGCAGGEAGVTVATEKMKSMVNVDMDYISGKTEALESATIVPKVSGRVSQVAVDVGSRVKAGQVLMKIDLSDVEAQREQYRAAVDEAEAGVKKAMLDVETARVNYERAKSLFETGALSRSDLENKYAAPYEQARIQAEESAPKKLAQARATLQYAEANYSNSVITSPIDGEVTSRSINQGEMCSPTKAAFFVADLSSIAVVAYLDEKKVNSLKVGQKVSVKLDSSEKVLEAEVKNISQTLDPAARGYQVKFLIKDAVNSVRPGMSARIYTGVGEAPRLFNIPKGALVNENGNYSVFVYSAGKVTRIPVQVNRVSDIFAVVEGGLSDGQDLVVYSSSRLEDGMQVRVR